MQHSILLWTKNIVKQKEKEEIGQNLVSWQKPGRLPNCSRRFFAADAIAGPNEIAVPIRKSKTPRLLREQTKRWRAMLARKIKENWVGPGARNTWWPVRGSLPCASRFQGCLHLCPVCLQLDTSAICGKQSKHI